MRSIWTGAISFGLVNIPVRIYSATSSETLNFNLLDKKDHSPIKYERISLATDKKVEYKDLVRGYEYERGQFVVLSDKDFEMASPEKTKAIQIIDFVREEEIESIYFEKPYYLEPAQGAEKPYALLQKALKESRKVGIAQFVMRNREHLAALKSYENMIILNQLRFQSEINKPTELHIPDSEKISIKEMDMALKLIDQLTKKFNPEAYVDTYNEELKKIIDAKVHGRKLKPVKITKQTVQTKDLLSVLKESLRTGKKAA